MWGFWNYGGGLLKDYFTNTVYVFSPQLPLSSLLDQTVLKWWTKQQSDTVIYIAWLTFKVIKHQTVSTVGNKMYSNISVCI